MKYFTPAEAEALIPELEAIFAAVAELTSRAEKKAAAVSERRASGKDEDAASAIDRSQLQFLASLINEKMQRIVELGALPKGVGPALVDFPSRVDGQEAYLCWQLGEKRVAFYHPVNEGFSTRRPLPKRPGRT